MEGDVIVAVGRNFKVGGIGTPRVADVVQQLRLVHRVGGRREQIDMHTGIKPVGQIERRAVGHSLLHVQRGTDKPVVAALMIAKPLIERGGTRIVLTRPLAPFPLQRSDHINL